jgi:hypothetical protein
MSPTLQRFWVQLTADRRRFGVLCAVMAVGLLLWARLIIVSNMPRTAVATPVVTSNGAPGAADQRRSANPESSSADKSGGAGAGRSSRAAAAVVDVQLDHAAQRDPFVISPLHFPRRSDGMELQPNEAKLPTEPAEDLLQKEARQSARLRELLSELRLEAVLGGSRAVIGGRSYRLGERLPALGSERVEFTLVEVKERSVVLECQGSSARRFEIEMSSPGSGK